MSPDTISALSGAPTGGRRDGVLTRDDTARDGPPSPPERTPPMPHRPLWTDDDAPRPDVRRMIAAAVLAALIVASAAVAQAAVVVLAVRATF